MAKELTDQNFEQEVLQSDKPVLVDFFFFFCGPCLAMAPTIDELSADYDGKALIGKLDVDNNPNVAQKYGIRNIPTLLVFKGGEVVDKQVGATSKNVLAKKIDNQI